MLAAAGVEAPDCEVVGTILHVLVDGVYAGHIVIADTVKADAEQTIRDLHAAGINRTVMLTGDREEVAASVAKQLGLDEFHAQLLPGDKVERVEALLAAESGKGKLAFVGDGINDAPVLTRADVGIAMGAMAPTPRSRRRRGADGRQAVQHFPRDPRGAQDHVDCLAEHNLYAGH